MVQPLKIEWYICRADASDVAHSAKSGKPLKIGDELWRSVQSIGSLSPDHDHWSGNKIDGDEAEILMASASPVLLHTVKEMLARCSMSDAMKAEAEAAVKLATTGEWS